MGFSLGRGGCGCEEGNNTWILLIIIVILACWG